MAPPTMPDAELDLTGHAHLMRATAPMTGHLPRGSACQRLSAPPPAWGGPTTTGARQHVLRQALDAVRDRFLSGTQWRARKGPGSLLPGAGANNPAVAHLAREGIGHV